MRKSLAYSLVALSILLVLSATISSTAATDYTKVGVKVGDTADYRVSQSFLTDNKTRVYFTYISGSMVTFDDLSFWPNGTLHSSNSITGNVSDNGFLVFIVLIASGLKVGDNIGTNPTSATIDGNSTLNVAGTSRLTNHAKENVILASFDAYWDQETGLLVQGNFMLFGAWLNATLISTTLWSSGGGLSMSAVALGEGVVIVVLLIAMFFVARRGARHKH